MYVLKLMLYVYTLVPVWSWQKEYRMTFVSKNYIKIFWFSQIYQYQLQFDCSSIVYYFNEVQGVRNMFFVKKKITHFVGNINIIISYHKNFSKKIIHNKTHIMLNIKVQY